jgi:hypothetical protein
MRRCRGSRRLRRSGRRPESPALELTTLSERELVIGVSAGHPFASAQAVEVEELKGQVWVASRSEPGESLLGVWPGLAERPDVRYVVRDWLAKLQIVAVGLPSRRSLRLRLMCCPRVSRLSPCVVPQETRRVVVARRPGPLDGPAARVANALIAAAPD